MIDLNLIEKGEEYNKLNKSYIIFICMKDIFKKGRHIYTFRNVCLEDTSVLLKDDATRIFLNPYSDMDDVSPELKNFLSYLADGNPRDEFTGLIDKEVEKVKKNEKWRREYMTLQMRYQEMMNEGLQRGLRNGMRKGKKIGKELGIAEGRVEGRAEGRAEGKAEGIESGLTALVNTLKNLLPDLDSIYEAIIHNEEYKDVTIEQVKKYY